VRQEDNVQSFALEGNRIGILKRDGTLFVKEGDPSATWVRQEDNIKLFALARRWIGVLRPTGRFQYKDGALDAQWSSDERTQVGAFQLMARDLSPTPAEAHKKCSRTQCAVLVEVCCDDSKVLGVCVGRWSCGPVGSPHP
jgi:hypothetical protein